jgi:hypothetical protein
VDLIGMVPLSLALMATIVAIVLAYVVASELLKGQINLLGLSPRPLGATTRGAPSVLR